MASILSWNIGGLPLSHINKKIEYIIDYILSLNTDIICLQEMWLIDIHDYIIKRLNQAGYNVSIGHKNKWNRVGINSSGLLIASKYKILHSDFIPYDNRYGIEKMFVHKGILSVKIYNSKLKKEMYIHTTHLQSCDGDFNYLDFYNKKCITMRNLQLKQLNNHINKYSNYINIISGDLNFSFDTYVYKRFIYNFEYNNKLIPTNELITYDHKNDQRHLDYIICLYNNENNNEHIQHNSYEIHPHDSLSDHNIIIMNVKNEN